MTERSRTLIWSDPYDMAARRLATDGLSFFSAIAAGELPPPPIYPLMNIQVLEVEHGRSRIACEPTDQLYNPLGTLHGGVPATLIDTAMGIATQSTQPQGHTVATIRLHVDYLRGISAETGTVYCEGQVVRAGRQVAVTKADITDAEGRLYSRGHATFMVTPVRAPEPSAAPPERKRHFSWPDPAIIPAAAPGRRGLDLLREMRDGALPHPSICDTLDYRLTGIDDGRAVFECDVQEIHYNPMGGAHGGLAATLLDSSTGVAVHSTLEPGEIFTTVFLWTEFFKGLTVDTGRIRCEGRVVKNGASIVVADGEVVDESGTVYARGSSTCLKMRMG